MTRNEKLRENEKLFFFGVHRSNISFVVYIFPLSYSSTYYYLHIQDESSVQELQLHSNKRKINFEFQRWTKSLDVAKENFQTGVRMYKGLKIVFYNG